MQQAAAQFLSQVVLNQPQRRAGSGSASTPPGPTPPTTAPSPAPPAPPGVPYPYGHPYVPAHVPYPTPLPGYPTPVVALTHPGSSGGHSTGIGSWTKAMPPAANPNYSE
ncbi:hypothetical protein [Streptomyces sp. NPDC059092]|uniref:hypothetical protein n=1 Tax=Streptomyces sp. NPDC059092 TaxID=3346725 RepID=UPI003675BE3B